MNNDDEIVVIYDQLLEETLQFFVTTDARFAEMNGVYINSSIDEDKWLLLHDLIYDDEGDKRVSMSPVFPVDAVRRGASVIVCGFIP